MEVDKEILNKLEACRKTWLHWENLTAWENPTSLQARSTLEDQQTRWLQCAFGQKATPYCSPEVAFHGLASITHEILLVPLWVPSGLSLAEEHTAHSLAVLWSPWKAPGAAFQWLGTLLQKGRGLLSSHPCCGEGTKCFKWVPCCKPRSYCSSPSLHRSLFAEEGQLLLWEPHLCSHLALTPV